MCSFTDYFEFLLSARWNVHAQTHSNKPWHFELQYIIYLNILFIHFNLSHDCYILLLMASSLPTQTLTLFCFVFLCCYENFPLWRSIRFFSLPCFSEHHCPLQHVNTTQREKLQCLTSCQEPQPQNVSTILEDLGEHLKSKLTHTTLIHARWL